jgi:phosphate transport system permease protein
MMPILQEQESVLVKNWIKNNKITKSKEEVFAKSIEKIFSILCFAATILPLLILAWLIINTVIVGLNRIDFNFIIRFPSRFAHEAGIFPALVGTFYLMALTAVIALPLGFFAAVYLEEYAKQSWYKKLIELNVTNLAGVPSIIFGLLGLELFVGLMNLGPSLIAGALTLSLLILPVVITTTRESLKSVPISLKEAGFALGGAKIFVILRIVLPLSMSQIITGAILSISRVIGESAPLIVIGAASYIAFIPTNPMSEFSALPLQIFQWVERPHADFIENASAGIVVLLIILVVFNGIAAWLRQRQEKNRGNL